MYSNIYIYNVYIMYSNNTEAYTVQLTSKSYDFDFSLLLTISNTIAVIMRATSRTPNSIPNIIPVTALFDRPPSSPSVGSVPLLVGNNVLLLDVRGSK